MNFRSNKKYTVVEFEDGVALVPSLWLIEDGEKCRWPMYGDNAMKFNFAVGSCEVPPAEDGSLWTTLSVWQIICTASKFTIFPFRFDVISILSAL